MVHFRPASGWRWERSCRCGDRAGRASCGGPLPSGARSTSPTRISSRSWEASASTRPNGSQRNEPPQNSRPWPARLAADIAGFEADAVHHADVDAVGDGVGALDGAPGVVLRRAELGLLGGMPADGGGIEQNARALQRRQARAFGIPLVPADERADAAERVSKARNPRSPGVK